MLWWVSLVDSIYWSEDRVNTPRNFLPFSENRKSLAERKREAYRDSWIILLYFFYCTCEFQMLLCISVYNNCGNLSLDRLTIFRYYDFVNRIPNSHAWYFKLWPWPCAVSRPAEGGGLPPAPKLCGPLVIFLWAPNIFSCEIFLFFGRNISVFPRAKYRNLVCFRIVRESATKAIITFLSGKVFP
jgi:hypothetical protein